MRCEGMPVDIVPSPVTRYPELFDISLRETQAKRRTHEHGSKSPDDPPGLVRCKPCAAASNGRDGESAEALKRAREHLGQAVGRDLGLLAQVPQVLDARRPAPDGAQGCAD